MDAPSARLRDKDIIRFIAGIIGIAALLFLIAGSFLFHEGWIYMGVVFVPLIFAVSYFLKTDSGLLERRMKMQEKEAEQKCTNRLYYSLRSPSLSVFLLPDWIIVTSSRMYR